ncbi:Ig-like domain-containing protein [Vibrio penaeicida]|uniref:Ig-like domain-containing protein n=1 Tax=Vibrio penaeicida TaxID=104609 RepID=UPI00142E0D0E|nr:Ig-like domain-containing protein [Vibrio penaeicida]
MRTFLKYLFCLMGVLSLLACGGESSNSKTPTTVAKNLMKLELSTASTSNGNAALLVPLGEEVKFTLLARYSDASTSIVSSGVSWGLSDSSVVENPKGLSFTSKTKGLGKTTLTAHYKGFVSNSVEIEVTDAVLKHLEVVSLETLYTGSHYNLVAYGEYSDGQRRDVTKLVSFSSGDASVVSVRRDVLVAKSEGKTEVQAQWKSVLSAPIEVTVKDPQVRHIQLSKDSTQAEDGLQVSLPLGTQETFIVNSVYEDGRTENITSKVQWHSDNQEVLEFAQGGIVKAKKVGSAVISASYSENGNVFTSNGIGIKVVAATLTKLMFVPANQTLPVGTSLQLSVLGEFSDFSKKNLTNSVVWESNSIEIAKVVRGLVKGDKKGKAQITASMNGMSVTVDVFVTSAVLQSIEVMPIQRQVPAGLALIFEAQGQYSDGQSMDVSDKVVWESSNPTIATFNGRALTAKKPGSIDVTASMQLISSDTLTITVTPATFQNLVIRAEHNSIANGHSLQINAEAQYSDNTKVNVTNQVSWSSEDTQIATVSSAGVVNALKEGRVSINAMYQGRSTKYALEVTSAVLTRIEIQQKNVELYRAIQQKIHLRAKGFYSDGTTNDISRAVTWSSLSQDIMVTVSGAVWPVSAGKAQVVASIGKIKSDPVTVTVSDSEVSSIHVTPDSLSIVERDWRRLGVEVSMVDGGKVDVSLSPEFFANSKWVVADTDILSVYRVILSAKSTGTTSIQADFKSKVSGKTFSSNSVDITVKPMRICGGKVNDTHIGNAAGDCLKVVEHSGKLFTGTPSKALIDYIGGFTKGTDTSTYLSRHFHSIHTEDGKWGPKGDFVYFRNNPSLTGRGEFHEFCKVLADINFHHRSDWKPASIDELSELRKQGDMHKLYGWPTSSFYWSGTPYHDGTPNGQHHALELMLNFFKKIRSNTSGNYISCVSSR